MEQENHNSNATTQQLPQLLGRRVNLNDYRGTVRFAGGLVHEGKPEGSENQVWLGIEWDDPTRGRHNGTVKNHTYF